MKLKKVLEIKDKCSQCQNSLEIEEKHPEWNDCRKCPLGGSIEIEIQNLSSTLGLEGVILTVNTCLILEVILGKIKAKRSA